MHGLEDAFTNGAELIDIKEAGVIYYKVEDRVILSKGYSFFHANELIFVRSLEYKLRE